MKEGNIANYSVAIYRLHWIILCAVISTYFVIDYNVDPHMYSTYAIYRNSDVRVKYSCEHWEPAYDRDRELEIEIESNDNILFIEREKMFLFEQVLRFNSYQ